jgi:hypothetical protein
MTRPTKLEGLPCVTLSSRVLELRARPEQTQFEDLSDASFLGKLLVLPAKGRLDWKGFARCKHSSLFGHTISNKEKSFIKLTPGVTVNSTTFFSSSLTLRQNKLECLSLESFSVGPNICEYGRCLNSGSHYGFPP